MIYVVGEWLKYERTPSAFCVMDIGVVKDGLFFLIEREFGISTYRAVGT